MLQDKKLRLQQWLTKRKWPKMVAWAISPGMLKISTVINELAITATTPDSVPITKVFSLKKQLPRAKITAVVSATVIPNERKSDSSPENKSAPCEMAYTIQLNPATVPVDN